MRIVAAPMLGLRSASPAASGVVVEFPVRPKRKSSGVVPPQPQTKGMSAAMAAHAELKEIVPDSERALALEIAKAMQPPLMSRLARIQGSFGELASADAAEDAPAGPIPPPVPATPMPAAGQPWAPIAAPLPPSPALMDLIADDPDAGFATPPAAEWLGKARRERNRARLRNGLAWLATLAIGGGIVAATMLMLPH